MHRHAAVLTLVALVTGSVTALYAQADRGIVEVNQSPILRRGVYFTASLGAGREECRFSDVECGTYDASGNILPDDGQTWRSPLTSPAFQLRVGGTVNQNLRLGAEFFGWSGDNGPTTERSYGLLASAQVYPSVRSGFYFKGGAGYAWNSDDFNDGTQPATDNGFMFNVGAGYEFRVGRNIALGPVADYYHSNYSSLGQTNLYERFIFVGLSATFQSGRRW